MEDPVRTIEDVVAALDRIIHFERGRGSRGGYFPCMYRATTLRVRRGLAEGRFRDPARMEALDVVFARYYLRAWREASVGNPCSGPWRVAFRAARNPDLLILQHLLLGMNAHILLDLSLATAEVAGTDLAAAEADFDTINGILREQLDEVQAALGTSSPDLAALDRAGGPWDERLFHFSLARARDLAWREACVLVSLPPAARPRAQAAVEARSTTAARVLARVSLPTTRRREADQDAEGVRRVIDTLWALA